MERGRMRRRLRERRRVRDEKLLDLGALVFELYRQDKRAPELLPRKAAELDEIESEVRALEDALEGAAPGGEDAPVAEGAPAEGEDAAPGGEAVPGDRAEDA